MSDESGAAGVRDYTSPGQTHAADAARVTMEALRQSSNRLMLLLLSAACHYQLLAGCGPNLQFQAGPVQLLAALTVYWIR